MSADFRTPQETVSSSSGGEVPSPDLPSSATRPPGEARKHRSPVENWLNRIAVVLFISLCASFGVLLVILPWTPKWTDNYMLISYPNLRDLLENGFVRGMCSGLGLLDIWIGFSEATHYHEAENQL
ncbi:MAG: hypothetical protein ACRD2U_13315 [Terriglobales bacterium]